MSIVITDNEVKSFIAANLRTLLADRGVSARWLMLELGLKEGTFYPIYNGAVMPGVAVMARISDILGVSVDDLCTRPIPKISEKSTKSRKRA